MKTHPDGTVDSRWRDPEIVLLIGLVYFLSILIVPALMEGIGVPQSPTPEYLARHGSVHPLSLALVELPAMAFLFIYLRYAGAEFLKLQLVGEGCRTQAAVFLFGFFLSVLLDRLGILPFVWKEVGDDSLRYGRVLLDSRAFFGLVVLGVSGVVITPILEETIFRFGVLQWMLRRTNSWALSVTLSALLFGGAHITAITRYNPRLAVQTFAFGLAVGWCVFKRQGRIGIAIALHAAKNAAEFVSLIVAASLG